MAGQPRMYEDRFGVRQKFAGEWSMSILHGLGSNRQKGTELEEPTYMDL